MSEHIGCTALTQYYRIDDSEQVILYNPENYPIGSCAQLFQDMQLEKNRLVVMAKVRPAGDDEEEPFAIAQTETEVLLKDEGAEKEFRFHKVFSPSEDNATVFEYLKFNSECVVQGEDCNILAYGGNGSGKTHVMFGTSDEEGLLFLYIQHLKDIIQERGLSATISVSLVSVDDTDTPRDLLKPGGPQVWKMKFSRDRYDGSLKNIYKAELLDTSELERVSAEGIATLKSQITTALSYRSGKTKNANYIATVYYDGEDSLLETHGRLTLVELISSDWMKKAGSIDKTRSAFHDVMHSLLERRMVSYQQGYLTYILRDQLCLGVRTSILVTIDSTRKKMMSTTNTISFAADIDLDYDLGCPVSRVISKQYEYDHTMLLHLVKELEGKNQCMIDHLKECLSGEKAEHRIRAQLMSDEINLKKEVWLRQHQTLKRGIKTLEEDIAKNRDLYDKSDNERRDVARKLTMLESEFNQRKNAQRGQAGYVPLKAEYEIVQKEHSSLIQKREEYKMKLVELSQKLDEFRALNPNTDESMLVEAAMTESSMKRTKKSTSMKRPKKIGAKKTSMKK